MNITLTRRITLRDKVSEQVVEQFKDFFKHGTAQVLKTGKTKTGQFYLVVQFDSFMGLLAFELARKQMVDDVAIMNLLKMCESSNEE